MFVRHGTSCCAWEVSDSGNTENEMDIVENSDEAGFDFNLFGSL